MLAVQQNKHSECDGHGMQDTDTTGDRKLEIPKMEIQLEIQ